MTLTAIGWIVVFSLWQVTLVAGVAAAVLGALQSARPQRRYAVALAALGLAAAMPLLTAAANLNSTRPRLSPATLAAIDGFVDVPAFMWWASVVIPLAGAAWLVGVSAGVVRLVVAVRGVRTLRRQAVLLPPATLTRAYRRVARREPCARGIVVRTSDHADVPMLIGWRRPLIVFPAGAAHRLSARGLRGLVAHELEHVRRRDVIVNIAQLLIDIALFHHPLARWLSRTVRTEREYCCDDAALRAAGSRRAYARALAELEDGRAASPLAVAAVSGTLLGRLQRIAGVASPRLTPVRGALACLAAIASAAVIAAISQFVPPRLPFAVEMRRRSPGPAVQAPAPTQPPLPMKERSR